MGVSGRHLNRLVPHQLLYRFQRDSCHDQAAGKCVAETMPTEIPDLGFQHRILKPAPDRLPDQGLSVIGKKHLLCMAGDQKLPLEGRQRRRVQGNDSTRSVLGLEQLDPLPFQVHLIPGKRKLLRPSHAGMQGNLEFIQESLRVFLGKNQADRFFLFVGQKTDASVVLFFWL